MRWPWALWGSGSRSVDFSLVGSSLDIFVSSNLSSGEDHVGLYALNFLDSQSRGTDLGDERTLVKVRSDLSI
jgi:hypothetical protein